MAIDVAVFLPCEHWTTVEHEQGERRVTCQTCGHECTVKADPVTIIRYLVSVEIYDEDGNFVRSEWRTMADIQAEIEARQILAAKLHAAEDAAARELDCPVYQVGDTFPPNPRVGDELPEQLESD